jgi:hypothetical protein
MSHFTRIRTQMVEEKYLIQALQDLEYEYEAGDVHIRGFGWQRQKVNIRVKTPGYDVGFRKVGQVYELVADWWGVRGTNRAKFLQRITQRYAYHAARAKLEAQGFALVSEEVEAGDRIHMVLRRMA